MNWVAQLSICTFVLGASVLQAQASALGRLSRDAQCLIEIKGVHVWGGKCTFSTSNKDGSFRVETPRRLSAEVNVVSGLYGVGSWSGREGGNANNLKIGSLWSHGKGCWSNGEEDASTICAFGSDARVYLGPMHDDKDDLAWGERRGMGARIIARSGLDTDRATITAEKTFGGAVDWCRSNFDYSLHCIDDTLNGGPVPRRVTMHANCRTKRFTDFWGAERKYLGDEHILDLALNEEAEGSAGNWGVSYSAIKALCPKTLETPASR